MPLALGDLFVIAALFVALGLILGGKAFIDAMLWIIKSSVGRVPLIGGVFVKPGEVALQKLSNAMGGLANHCGELIAANWHYLATIVDRVGWATFHLALAIDRLYAYVTVGYPLHILWATAKRAEALALRGGKAVGRSIHVTKIIERTIVKPVGSALAPAIRAVTKPLAAELHRFEAWARHAIAVAGGDVIAIPAKVGSFPRQLRNIRTRLTRLEKITAGLTTVALVGTALRRMGLDWLKCRNVKRAGRAVCGMDANLFEALLLDAAALTVAFNIEAFARELQGITGEAAHLIRDFAE